MVSMLFGCTVEYSWTHDVLRRGDGRGTDHCPRGRKKKRQKRRLWRKRLDNLLTAIHIFSHSLVIDFRFGGFDYCNKELAKKSNVLAEWNKCRIGFDCAMHAQVVKIWQ